MKDCRNASLLWEIYHPLSAAGDSLNRATYDKGYLLYWREEAQTSYQHKLELMFNLISYKKGFVLKIPFQCS